MQFADSIKVKEDTANIEMGQQVIEFDVEDSDFEGMESDIEEETDSD